MGTVSRRRRHPTGRHHVSATNGTVTSTATTVTAGPVGSFTLPDLPVPGDYIVTISGDGYQTQTRSLSFGAGVGSATMDVTLVATQGRVTGSVLGKDVNGKDEGTLVGVGMTLTNSQTHLQDDDHVGTQGTVRLHRCPPRNLRADREPSSGANRRPRPCMWLPPTTASQNLVLVASSSTVLPPNSFIKGSVADSTGLRPAALRPPRAAAGREEGLFATVTVATSHRHRARRPSRPLRTSAYQIPTRPSQRRLTPGLYTITVTAPGYEPTVTQVQVGQSQTLTAPPISMAGPRPDIRDHHHPGRNPGGAELRRRDPGGHHRDDPSRRLLPRRRTTATPAPSRGLAPCRAA